VRLRHTAPMRGCVLPVAMLLLLLSLAAPAGAQVHVDPDSPTGQEYDIPLERARRQASSNPQAASQPSRSASEALFGEGIEPAAGASSGDGGSASGGSTSGGSGKRRAGRPPKAERDVPATVQAAVESPGAPGDGSTSALLLGGIAALVLAGGVAAGLALRRRGS
jgi:hypothetical protein